MKKYFVSAFFFAYAVTLTAQKRILDQTVFNSWPQIDYREISNDGRYIAYGIEKNSAVPKLVVQAVNSSWKKEIYGGVNAAITHDSKRLICRLLNDSLAIIDLGKNKAITIPRVRSFKMPDNDNGRWMAYQLTDTQKTAILFDLYSGKKMSYTHIDNFYFNDTGSRFLLQTPNETSPENGHALIWMRLPEGKPDTIMRSKNRMYQFTFDNTGDKLAFLIEDNAKSISLAYYETGLKTAVVKVDKKMTDTKGMAICNGRIYFNPGGNKIFFNLRKITEPVLLPDSSKPVDLYIWNYKDDYLQPEQIKKLDEDKERQFQAVVDIHKQDSVLYLQTDHDGEFLVPHNINYGFGSTESSVDGFWRPSSRADIFLVSTEDGSRTILKKSFLFPDNSTAISTGGKYVTWYDHLQKKCFSYNINNGEVENIAKDIPISPAMWCGAIYWTKNDSLALINDGYDIWKVDPGGIKKSVNITDGYGRKNNITFNIEYIKDRLPFDETRPFVISAFNNTDKNEGFFLFKPGHPLQELAMAPVHYKAMIKAKYSDTYIIERTSATDYPNLFVTKDFRHFQQVTNLAPHKEFNWYTTSVLKWKMFDGRQADGVLYKPENFDSAKKYPVIFYYYEEESEKANRFLLPELCSSAINIPWFVSRGYIVFVPDIYYTRGYIGESAYNSVVSAARFLSKMPWADSTKFGLQGSSFGGYETNYIITRTNMFAAAVSASGISNIISQFGSLRGHGESAESLVEAGQMRMDVTPWGSPETYVRNSPIFYADKVNTPLLIMANDKDGLVPWQQSIEWFTALRRLNRKVWMLQYAGEGHWLDDEKNQQDYTVRLMQFFDHYLKGAPAPRWMTQGVPAKLKNIETGLELDASAGEP